jgi:hypothetical protein
LSSSLVKEAVYIVAGRVKVCMLSMEEVIEGAYEESSDVFGRAKLRSE